LHVVDFSGRRLIFQMRDWGCGEPMRKKGVTVRDYGWG